MRSIKSLLLGSLIVIAYAFLDAYLNLPCHRTTLWLPLAVMAVMVLIVNPICRKLPFLTPFDHSELALLATMTMVAAAVIGTGVPVRFMGAAVALHHPGFNTQQTAWNETIAAALPDYLTLAPHGTQQEAQILKKTIATQRREQQTLDEMLKQRELIQQEQQQLFDKYLTLEAKAYHCTPEAIAGPRNKREELQRQLIQVTRALNEQKANPDNARPKTREQALALNRKLAALYGKRQKLKLEIKQVNDDLKQVLTKPAPEELPKINALKQEIQGQQAKLRQADDDIKQQQTLISSQKQAILTMKMALNGRLQATQNTCENLLITNPEATKPTLRQCRNLCQNVPWDLWLKPLLAWGILLTFALILIHNLSIILVRQWTACDSDKPDFPLARVLQDALPVDERHPGLNLFHNAWFYLGLLLMAALSLARIHLRLPQVFTWHENLMPTLQPLAAELPLSLSLPVIALALLLPARMTRSLWSAQILVVLTVGMAIPFVPNIADDATPMLEAMLPAKTAFSTGAAAVLGLLFLWQAKSLLFCALHPYDIPHTKRAERRDLTHASAIFMLCICAFVIALSLILDLKIQNAVIATFLFMLLITIAMRLSAELGFVSCPATLPPLPSLPHAWPPTPPTALALNLLATSHNCPVQDTLPQTVTLRNGNRIKYPFYQFAIIGTLIVGIAMVTCGTLMLIYAQQPTKKLLESVAEAGQFYEALARSPQTMIPQGFLMAGMVAGVAAMALRRLMPLIPKPVALVMVAFPLLAQHWSSCLIGWVLVIAMNRWSSDKTRQNVRCLAIGILVAALVGTSLMH